MTITVAGAAKHFVTRRQQVLALQKVDLEIATGEFVAFLGPSGCGKSTLLNMIAGIIPASSGEIAQDGRVIERINTQVGYMTQADNLLPWRTAEENVMLPLVIRGEKPSAARAKAHQALARVNLTEFGKAYPAELSGGMRKRVALAQIMAYDPAVLLMDEPFGALDAQLKLVMQQELLDLWGRTSKTIIFVTHDVGEAIALADRVVVFSGRPGRIKHIEKIDYSRPRDVFKVRFSDGYNALFEKLWCELSPEFARN
jgi:NitT/TauT family transport system ATP-binding protein